MSFCRLTNYSWWKFRTTELPAVKRSMRVHFEQSMSTVSPFRMAPSAYQTIFKAKCAGKYKKRHLDTRRNCRNLLLYQQQQASILQRVHRFLPNAVLPC
jgi:hypothetical protein